MAGDGGIGDWRSTGWQPWFSDSGFNQCTGCDGTGHSLHMTTFPNASLSFQFYGTVIHTLLNAHVLLIYDMGFAFFARR